MRGNTVCSFGWANHGKRCTPLSNTKPARIGRGCNIISPCLWLSKPIRAGFAFTNRTQRSPRLAQRGILYVYCIQHVMEPSRLDKIMLVPVSGCTGYPLAPLPSTAISPSTTEALVWSTWPSIWLCTYWFSPYSGFCRAHLVFTTAALLNKAGDQVVQTYYCCFSMLPKLLDRLVRRGSSYIASIYQNQPFSWKIRGSSYPPSCLIRRQIQYFL